MVVIGIDIGGTKVHLGAVVLSQGIQPDAIVLARQIPTPRTDPAAFYDALAAAVRELQQSLTQQGRTPLPALAVAHPGRFLPDGTLARGTTPNLGLRPNQFDGCAPARELERRLGLRVIAENDAVAQMRYGIHELLRDPAAGPRLLGETVVYLGPGTGMGGGVARVGRGGDVTPVTDGHLFDLLLPGYGGEALTAEELFTGPAIARRVAEANRTLSPPIEPARGGTLDELLGDPQAPPAHRRVAEEFAAYYGQMLAALIETIRAGRITKVRLETDGQGRVARHVDEPDRAWSEADRAIVRGARRIVFGGFLGCSRHLGARVRATALELLRQRQAADVEIFQIPSESGDAGLLGIARAIAA